MTTHRETSEINVTPFLDVLLVLLVTFISLMMHQRRTMDVMLPQPCVGVCEQTSTPIVLEVGPAGRYAVQGQPVASGDLRRYLASIYFARPEKIIFVRSRPGVSYQEMIAAMDVAHAAGVKVIGLGEDRFAAR